MHWFWIDFNFLSTGFKLVSIDFSSRSIDFNLLPVDFQLIPIYFQVYNFQVSLNWFQSTEPGGWFIRGNHGFNQVGHGLMGVPFVSYPNWCFFLKNLIGNRSLGEGWFPSFSMISNDKKDRKIEKKNRKQIEKRKFENQTKIKRHTFQHWSAMSSVAAYILTIDLRLVMKENNWETTIFQKNMILEGRFINHAVYESWGTTFF